MGVREYMPLHVAPSSSTLSGVPPLGYRAQDRKLVIIDSEAEIVCSIFRRYADLGSVRLLKDELEARRIDASASGRLVGGKPFSRGARYLILQNLSLEDPDRRK